MPPTGRPSSASATPLRSRLCTACVAGGAALLPLLLAAIASAAPIPVNNPSFEILPPAGLPNACGPGCSYAEDYIPGWVNVPFAGLGLSSGQWRPGTDSGNTTYFDTLPDGPTTAFTTTGCIAQTLAVTVQAGVTYTLTADVGWRKGASALAMPRIVVNGTFYDGTGTPVLGGWAPFTATYVAQPADVGAPITICLSSVTFQGNFDNVRFSDSTSPTGVEIPVVTPALALRAWPNPFGAVTTIHYTLPRPGPLDLRVLDVSGRPVRTLAREAAAPAGAGEITWDGRDDGGGRVAAGIYFLRIVAGADRRVERLLLVR